MGALDLNRPFQIQDSAMTMIDAEKLKQQLEARQVAAALLAMAHQAT